MGRGPPDWSEGTQKKARRSWSLQRRASVGRRGTEQGDDVQGRVVGEEIGRDVDVVEEAQSYCGRSRVSSAHLAGKRGGRTDNPVWTLRLDAGDEGFADVWSEDDQAELACTCTV